MHIAKIFMLSKDDSLPVESMNCQEKVKRLRSTQLRADSNMRPFDSELHGILLDGTGTDFIYLRLYVKESWLVLNLNNSIII